MADIEERFPSNRGLPKFGELAGNTNWLGSLLGRQSITT